MPKTLAIRQPKPVSQWIAYPLYVSYLVFYPLNWLLNAASRAILQAVRVKESRSTTSSLIPRSRGWWRNRPTHGGTKSGEAEYIQNVFRFGDLAVSDVWSTAPPW